MHPQDVLIRSHKYASCSWLILSVWFLDSWKLQPFSRLSQAFGSKSIKQSYRVAPSNPGCSAPRHWTSAIGRVGGRAQHTRGLTAEAKAAEAWPGWWYHVTFIYVYNIDNIHILCIYIYIIKYLYITNINMCIYIYNIYRYQMLIIHNNSFILFMDINRLSSHQPILRTFSQSKSPFGAQS